MLKEVIENSIVSVVIGGANGIGKAIAEAVADAKHRVTVADIDEERGISLAAQYEDVTYYPVDITEPSSLQELADYIQSDFGYLTHLVVTAGGSPKEETEATKNPNLHDLFAIPPKVIEYSVRLNLMGPIYAVKILCPLMRYSPQDDRSVLLTSSANSMGGYGQPAYAGAKAGLEGFARASTQCLGDDKIRINVLAPGATKTERTVREGMNFDATAEASPLDRYSEPEDMALTAMFLIQNRKITGERIGVDCGITLNRGGGSGDRYRKP